MRKFAIKAEHSELWGNNVDETTVVTEAEVEELSREWGKDVSELLDQLIEMDCEEGIMRIIERETGRTVAAIIANHSMTLDEAIDIAGERIPAENIGDPDVLINGEEFSAEELDIVC